MNAWLTFCTYAFWFVLLAAVIAVLVAWQTEYRARPYKESDHEAT